jgi:hypothetical protein
VKKAPLTELIAQLRRHVGHQLRCARETSGIDKYVIETVALRCEDCGEVVIEATQQLARLRSERRAR